jgi:hypothetical protein
VRALDQAAMAQRVEIKKEREREILAKRIIIYIYIYIYIYIVFEVEKFCLMIISTKTNCKYLFLYFKNIFKNI